MIYACALCPATCDGGGLMYGQWRVLNAGGAARYVCPEHWPKSSIYDEWTEAYRRNFEELGKLAPAAAAAK